MGLGLLALGIAAPEIEFAAVSEETSASAWSLPPWPRGKYFDQEFGKDILHPLQRTIDDFIDGNAISRKSMNVKADSYQDFDGLMSKLDQYFKKLQGFTGTNWGGDVIYPDEITDRTLFFIVQRRSLTPIQRATLFAAQRKANSLGLNLVIVEY